MFFKPSKEKAKQALENLEKAQKLLDERFEKGQMDSKVYYKQCQEFGKKRDTFRKILGEDLFNDITMNQQKTTRY